MKKSRHAMSTARLIAAAPDMEKALRRILNALDADTRISPDMPIKISCETNHAAISEARAILSKIDKGEA